MKANISTVTSFGTGGTPVSKNFITCTSSAAVPGCVGPRTAGRYPVAVVGSGARKTSSGNGSG